ncbi:hypothetical protein ACFV2H_47985 [Streptomyces sp. NPDC059629]|uniref:hypothetical protein n=1 Tax=Streptomyces sp. NPDC059629 TaxID=3346889 RepID=UPI0036B8A1B9
MLPFPIPHDFTDGLPVACRRRPEFFLDRVVRQANSTFAQPPSSVVDAAIVWLRDDLDSGAWRRQHADLLGKQSVETTDTAWSSQARSRGGPLRHIGQLLLMR